MQFLANHAAQRGFDWDRVGYGGNFGAGFSSYETFVAVSPTIGYRFTELGFAKELVLQLDATNLTDKEYFSTIDSNGFVERDPNGTAQTLLRGAPQQFFATLKVGF